MKYKHKRNVPIECVRRDTHSCAVSREHRLSIHHDISAVVDAAALALEGTLRLEDICRERKQPSDRGQEVKL